MTHKPLQGLADCIRDSTAARGVDYYACEVMRLGVEEWASMTDRDRTTVARNIRRARDDIDVNDDTTQQ